MFQKNPYPKGSVGYRLIQEQKRDQLPWFVLKMTAVFTLLMLVYLVKGPGVHRVDTTNGSAGLSLNFSHGAAEALSIR